MGSVEARVRRTVAGLRRTGAPTSGPAAAKASEAEATRTRRRREARHFRRAVAFRRAYDRVSLPVLTVFLFTDPRIHPRYRQGRLGSLRLARRMYRNHQQIETGTSYRALLAMAGRIMSIPPEVEGVIVECGCWKGGATANLSLVADIVDRTLVVYDSFDGLPDEDKGDRWSNAFVRGAFKGELETVKENVRRGGVIERCDFRKGWFADTLPHHREPVVAAYLDVDLQSSLHDCVLELWPHLTDEGYVFIDEYVRLDYCALFFSERWWRDHFDRPPPGLMGSGSGVAVGQHFVGPYRDRPPIQEPESVAWTRKDFYGEWDHVPDRAPAVRAGGGRGAAHGPEGWTTTEESMDEQMARDRPKLAAAMDDLADDELHRVVGTTMAGADPEVLDATFRAADPDEVHRAVAAAMERADPAAVEAALLAAGWDGEPEAPPR